jgi:hypothetical protein
MNKCQLCNRGFHLKTDQSKHQIYCTYLKNKTSSSEADTWEIPLSDSQKDAMLRHLLVQMDKMNDKMNIMQSKIQSLSQTQKINILHCLNSSEIKPVVTVQQWIKSISITQKHLEIVFQKSIMDSIVRVLLDKLESAKTQNEFIPIKCFVQKPKQLYVYNSNKKWEMMDLQQFRSHCSSIGSRFSELFIQWQIDHNEKLSTCQDAQEKQFLFMKKFMDESYKKSVHLGEICELIHERLKTSFQKLEYE